MRCETVEVRGSTVLARNRDRIPKAKVVKRKLGRREKKNREGLEGSQEVLVLGDSRIRYLDRTF